MSRQTKEYAKKLVEEGKAYYVVNNDITGSFDL